MKPIGLIIFDCDGVLVDSEPIANRILASALTDAGYRCTVSQCVERFVGRSLSSIIEIVEDSLRRPLPEDFSSRVQARTLEAFERGLNPVPGVEAVLDGLELPMCVASSGAVEKMELSLQMAGLREYFDDRLFSAAMVERGKPYPDLFLHAAEVMAVAPDACLVVEDSVPGVNAARAANMRVLGYTGGSHTGRGHTAALAEAGARVFSRMANLPRMIAGA